MIQFKKLIVHNFGSYGHTELDLQNRGFCLVTGQNNYIKDNALSNGSGKSFLWSAICYAITGETISGIKSNLKNINIEEPDCWVQLDFMYNKDLYSLVRYAAPKSDLKVLKNDVDIGGKGIRESEKRLQEALPELTKDLVASTIIIGQGMPNKFSSFSPSGRKELLEKLTKSDFMVEDLKNRIQARQQDLSVKVRELEDGLLANNTQLNSNTAALNRLKNELTARGTPDFEYLINEALRNIGEIKQEIDGYNATLLSAEKAADDAQQKLLTVSEEKSKVSNEELTAYTTSHTKLQNEKIRLEVTANTLEKEIRQLKAIKDVCPTCGQHLPNVVKPSTATQEQQLAELKQQLNEITQSIAKCEAQHNMYVSQIAAAFNDEIAALNKELADAKQTISYTKNNHTNKSMQLDSANATYNKLVYDKQNWDKYVASQQTEIARLEAEISRLTNLIAIINISKEDYNNRLAIIKKMDQLTRRDFRGYLLTNIISYIDNRAKEYCSTVFGTRELSLSLNGNALDITYCGKIFDGLSGGEKQRVDLILQLAIRDLLNSYLDLSANILVLDEITDFLDKRSCQAVMKLLEKELQTVESVFIISHHAEELELPTDSRIQIVKNAHGISELLDY
jgi:DNA repair exonuclease SbcCD ATPase subunit